MIPQSSIDIKWDDVPHEVVYHRNEVFIFLMEQSEPF